MASLSSCGLLFTGKGHHSNSGSRGGIQLDIEQDDYTVLVNGIKYPNPEECQNPAQFQIYKIAFETNDVIFLKKNSKTHTVTVQKKGYEDVVFEVHREFNPNTFWNVFNGGIFFLGSDLPFRGYQRFEEGVVKVELTKTDGYIDTTNSNEVVEQVEKNVEESESLVELKESITETSTYKDIGTFKPDLAMQTGHSSKVTDLEFNESGELLISCGSDGKIIVWDLFAGKQLRHITVKNAIPQNLTISNEMNQLAVGCSDSVVRIYSIPDLVHVDTIDFDHEVFDVMYSKTNPNNLLVGCKDLWEIDLNSKSKKSLLTVSDKFIRKSKKKNRSIFIGHNIYSGLYTLSFRNGDGILAPSKKAKYLDQNVSDSISYYASANGLVYKYDVAYIDHVFNGHGDARLTSVTHNQKSKLMASGDENGLINLWDDPSGLLVSSLKGGYQKINDLCFSIDGNEMIFCTENGKFKHWNLQTNEIKSSEVNPTELNAKKGWSYDVYRIVDLSDTKCVFEVKMSNSNAADKPKFLMRPKYYHLIWEFDTGVVRLEPIDDAEVEEIQPFRIIENPQYEFSAELLDDGRVLLIDKSSGNDILEIVALDEFDYAYITPEGYYYASKGALSYVGFRHQNKVYSFEQFDLKYNRPDLVFAKLPFSSAEVIDNFYAAYQKRLTTLGVKDVNDLDYIKGPKVEFERESIISTDLSKYVFQVKVEDELVELKTLKVFVNGVPLYGNEGLNIEGDKWQGEVAINLSSGENFIQVKAVNRNGVPSLTKSFKLECKYKFEKPDLYIVTLGSGKFKQQEFDLNYAAKDAKDVADCFNNLKGFGKKQELTFTDEAVTRTKLTEISNLLIQAKENDVVYVFIAGHGVLDANFDYYLSTYDIDFNNPSVGGIPYAELETILNRVKARRKVLILDACHSGEVDKEEVAENAENSVVREDDIVFRSVGTNVTNNVDIGLQNSFDLSKSIFAEMRSSGGTSVISSAGGGEYAMESSKWSNGVFTFCLLNGINNNKADLNGDGDILLSELQSYLFDEVSKLTNGKQQPTSRRENLNNNFVVK